MTETQAAAIIYNLAHTLNRACSSLKLCEKTSADGEEGSSVPQSGLAEVASFSLTCRLLNLLYEDDEGVTQAFLQLCPHMLRHMTVSGEDADGI